MNTTKEAVEPEIYDEVEEIKTSSTLTEQEAENLSDSSANDNGESGFPTPPTSEENIIDAEFSEDDIVNECNSLNSHVSIHSSGEKPKSTDLATIPDDCHALIIPDDPMELQKFVSTGKIFIDAAQKLKNKKNITVEEYKALHNRAKEYGFIVLDAGLKLSLAIKNITTKGGYRSDLHPDEDFRSKEQIIFENFGLTDSQSRIFRKLTVTAVDKEKAYARNNDTIPTLSHAAKFADEEKEKISEAKTKSKVKENSSDEDTTEINDNIPEGLFDIIHADITETINTKEAVLFIYGNLNEVTRQFAEMLKYCKKKKLHVVDMFFDISTISIYQKDCFIQMLDYLKHNKGKFAVVKSYNIKLKHLLINYLLVPITRNGKMLRLTILNILARLTTFNNYLLLFCN